MTTVTDGPVQGPEGVNVNKVQLPLAMRSQQEVAHVRT